MNDASNEVLQYCFFDQALSPSWQPIISKWSQLKGWRSQEIDKKNFLSEIEKTILISSGGDGTLNQTVRWLKENAALSKAKVLYHPNGTGNDFSRAVDLFGKTPEQMLDLIIDGEIRKIYIGRFENSLFVNMISAGVFGGVTPQVDPTIKSYLGTLSYYLEGLKRLTNFQAQHFKITSEDEVVFDGPALGFFVGNSVYSGGGIKVTDEASPLNQDLDLLVVKEAGLPTLLTLATELQKQQPDLSTYDVVYKKFKQIQFQSDVKIPLSLDGESQMSDHGKIEASNETCQIYLPKTLKSQK